MEPGATEYRILIFLILVMGVPDAATALGYRFEMVVADIDDPAGVSGLLIGDRFEIQIAVKDTIDRAPQLDTRGQYVVSEATYTFPSGEFVALIDDDSDAGITIFANDPVRDTLSYTVLNLEFDGSFEGLAASLSYGAQAVLGLTDSDGLWLQDDSIPTRFLDLEDYERITELRMTLTLESQPGAIIYPTLVGVRVVPEPSSGLLVLAGLIGMGAFPARRLPLGGHRRW